MLGLGHFVRHDENRAIAALLGDQGEADTRVAAGRFHDHTTRLELTGFLRSGDDALGNAVLG